MSDNDLKSCAEVLVRIFWSQTLDTPTRFSANATKYVLLNNLVTIIFKKLSICGHFLLWLKKFVTVCIESSKNNHERKKKNKIGSKISIWWTECGCIFFFVWNHSSRLVHRPETKWKKSNSISILSIPFWFYFYYSFALVLFWRMICLLKSKNDNECETEEKKIKESSTKSDLSMLIESRVRLKFVTLLSYRCTWCLTYTCYTHIYIYIYLHVSVCINRWHGCECDVILCVLSLCLCVRVMFVFVLIVKWHCWWPLDE